MKMFSRRLMIAMGLLVFVAGTLFIAWAFHQADRKMRQELLVQAKLVANAIDSKRLLALTGSEEDLNSPNYLRIKEQLTLVRQATPKCRFMYLFGMKPDDTMYFYVDSEPADSEDYSPPGQIYEEATDEDRSVFRTGVGNADGPPATDRWGTWISAAVPVIDPESGKVLASFGMDINADTWYWEVFSHAAVPSLLTLLILFLGVFLVVNQRVKRSIQGREAALRKSEEKYKILVESAQDVVLQISPYGILTYCSPVITAFAGYDPEEEIGQQIDKFFADPHQFEETIMILSEIIETRQPRSSEFLYQPKDREPFWVDVVGNPLIENDQVTAIHCVMRNISERKRTEEELRESEEQLRIILDAQDAGLMIIDTQTYEILFVNRKGLALFGAPNEKVVGEQCHMFICPAEKGACPVTDLGQDVDSSERVLLTASVVSQ